MQDLGIATTAPKAESRLRSIFWPGIQNAADVDNISRQGFWICVLIAVVNLALSLWQGSYLAGFMESAFYLLAGVGVRQRSRAAALLVCLAYLLTTVLLVRATGQGFGIIRVIFQALLISTVRGAWISSRFGSEETEPRLNQTFRDKLADQLPERLWPKTRLLFFALAGVEFVFLLSALYSGTI